MTNRLPSIDTNADDLVDNDKIEGLKNFGATDSFSGFPLTESDLDMSMTPTWTGTHTFNSGIKMATGTTIQDDNDDNRLGILSDRTAIYNAGGDSVLELINTSGAQVNARSGEAIRFRDLENNQTGIKYSVGNPGKLEMVNADLVIPEGRDIRDNNGNRRLAVDSGKTVLHGPDDHNALILSESSNIIQNTINSTYDWRILDEGPNKTVASVNSVSSGENRFVFKNAEVELRAHSGSNPGPSLRWYDTDSGDRIHFHVNSNGHFEMVPVDSSAGTQHWKSFYFKPTAGTPFFGNGIDLDNQLVNNKGGIWASTLGSVQNNAEDGIYAEIWGNVDINDSTFTKNSDTELKINETGTYNISCALKIERNGSGGRNIMGMRLEKNGSVMGGRTAVYGYIRNDTGGDLVTLDFDRNLDFSDGDTLKLEVFERNGGETGNDLIGGWADIEYIS